MTPAERRAVLRVLKKARALIRKGWTQGPKAVDRHGVTVDPTDKSACKWCAAGALAAAVGKDSIFDAFAVMPYREAESALMGPWVGLVEYNETRGRTKAQVLASFDKAIARLEA